MQPGRGGAGDTSPLWVLLLLPPYLLTQGHAPIWLVVIWSAVLGVAILGGLGIAAGEAAAQMARRAGMSRRTAILAAVLAALAVVTEWHLVWAAASGMETDLFALLVLVLILCVSRGTHPLRLGFLAAVAVAVRPEGALAAVLVGACSLWSVSHAWRASSDNHLPHKATGAARLDTLAPHLKQWARKWLVPFATGAIAGIVPYLVFNVVVGGQVLPTTFTAKSGEFSDHGSLLDRTGLYLIAVAVVLVATSPVALVMSTLACNRRLLRRIAGGVAVPSQGEADSSAVPVWVSSSRKSGPKSRMSGTYTSISLPLLLWLWPLTLVLAYFGRMVGNYHHGRYLIPMLPPLLALGAVGTAALLLDSRHRRLALVGSACLVVASLFSVGRAAQVQAIDVTAINCNEVETALWLREHTSTGALVATHDVGAIGYFSGHPILDISGLVDPEIVAVVHNESALDAYLAQRHVAYMVIYVTVFPAGGPIMRDLTGRAIYGACGGDFYMVYRTGW